jgi:hypothetical protein
MDMKTKAQSSQVDRPPTKADYRRYTAIVEQLGRDLELVGRALHRTGGNLKVVRDERLYRCGGYPTFEAFCSQVLGVGREYIYRTIQAYEVLCTLLAGGVGQLDLPTTERVCRELSAVPSDTQVAVWKRARQIARESGLEPDSRCVREAVSQVGDPAEVRQRQARETVQKFETLARQVRVSLASDGLSETDRGRLKEALYSIVTTTAAHLKELR